MVALVQVKEGDEQALAAAETLCNVQKLQQGSFRLPVYCEKAKIPGGRRDPRPALPDESRSAAMKAREIFGKNQRTGFYERMSGEKVEFEFTNSLEDMVADPPEGLPISLSNKIAVFYADGDKFGQRFKGA